MWGIFKNTANTDNEMGFLDHLEELRWHIVRSLVWLVIAMIVVFLSKNFIFDVLIFGPTKDSFITYRLFCELSESTCLSPKAMEVITKDLGEQFISHFKVSFWLGLVLAFPFIFREFWKFLKPGLLATEKKVSRGVVLVCSLLFMLGVSFGYFVVSPVAVTFLSNYSVSQDIANTLTLTSLVTYMTMFTIPTGVVFELPIVVYFLSKIGLLYPDTMRKYRKHAFIVILLLAAIITPPDVVTQFLIGIPLYFLYEVSIVVCKRVTRKNAAE